MKKIQLHHGLFFAVACLLLAMSTAIVAKETSKPIPLFDGKTFSGWEGNTDTAFRIEDGAIVAGNLKKPIPHNEFLATTRTYKNFVLRLECKLLGPTANGGIQIRSKRVPNHHEVSGYQADMDNEHGYWGCLYDESRRNKMLATRDKEKNPDLVKHEKWNRYEIRCDGPRIQLFVNGVKTADYTEPDSKIPREGIIAVQIHGGPASEAWYRNITIEELP